MKKRIFFCELIVLSIVWFESFSIHNSNLHANDAQIDSSSDGLIGIRVAKEGDYFRVIGVILGTPAEQSHKIKPGMLLLGIIEGNDSGYISVRQKSLDEVRRLLYGPVGKNITLELVAVSEEGIAKIECVKLNRIAKGNQDWDTAPSISRESTRIEYNRDH